MDKEDYIRHVMLATTKDTLQAMLGSREYSDLFLTRPDLHAIEDEWGAISEAIVNEFIASLREKGYFERGKEPSRAQFEFLFKKAIEDYLDKRGMA